MKSRSRSDDGLQSSQGVNVLFPLAVLSLMCTWQPRQEIRH
jgi:hypothetical protein